MKKIILAFALLFGVGINSLWAQQEIPMQIIDEMPAGAGNTLAPPRPWYITLEGQISMSGLNDGIYFLKVFIGGEVYSAKFVKR